MSGTSFNIHSLLKTLEKQNGSDLHLVVGSPPRIRVRGKLLSLNTPALTPEQSRHLCYSLLSEKQQKEFENNKELDFAFSVKGVGRYRGNIYHQKHHVGGAFRSIAETVPRFSELGLPGSVHQLSKLHCGLVLVCGATGSGKSTTLASLINEVNINSHGTIITIEDPIEYIHHHKNCLVMQREVYRDTLSFNNALKAALRQDPDIILVGEIRNLETMQLALTAAETGHLVFATMHTNSAISTINRIVDLFPAEQQSQVRGQLAFTLEGIVNQALLPSLKSGRVLALEILVPNLAIKALIRENKSHMIYSSMQTDREKSGMITYNQSLIDLLKTGHINQSMAFNYSPNPDELANMLERSGLAA